VGWVGFGQSADGLGWVGLGWVTKNGPHGQLCVGATNHVLGGMRIPPGKGTGMAIILHDTYACPDLPAVDVFNFIR